MDEQKEHEELSKLMEQLELEYGVQRKECEGTGVKMFMMEDVKMKSTENEEMNDILEHTILDKLLEEWVDDIDPELEDAITVDENDCGQDNENDCARPEIDECVKKSARCVGECSNICTKSTAKTTASFKPVSNILGRSNDLQTGEGMDNNITVCTVVSAITTTACGMLQI